MTRRLSVAFGLLLAIVAPLAAFGLPQLGSPASSNEHLARLAALEGVWIARGSGFSSRLEYEWGLPGVLLRARNELRNDAGDVVGRYEGAYMWDAGTSRLAFWTVGWNGELHRGTAVWQAESLWHDATVTGGQLAGYRSALAIVDGELHYRAVYSPAATDEEVLAAAALIYLPADDEKGSRMNLPGAGLDAAALEDFATRYTAAWCSQDAGSVAAFFAENGSLQINHGAPAVGREAITAAAQSFMTAFPDMVVATDSLQIDGPRVTYHWTLTGTNTGPGGTGMAVRISGREEWRFGADGLIAQSSGHFDEAEYARQLREGVSDGR